ncbi:putative aminopeptidase W07G4.4 isoform X2 [Oppia nitens]|nr:putative aminopeptidase W07G4.4 isoform X2 [Oppia nitens]
MVNLLLSDSVSESNSDTIVLLSLNVSDKLLTGSLAKYVEPLNGQKLIDNAFEKEGGIVQLSTNPVRRLVYSPVGSVNRDYDDVRRFSEAAYKGIKRAIKAGSKNPLVILPISDGLQSYSLFEAATVLGAYYALYVPLEIREAIPTRAKKLNAINFSNFSSNDKTLFTYRLANAIESGRIVARDIGGSDPERMAAPKVAQYVEELFKNSVVKVNIISDEKQLEKEFPCYAAVNRASAERHKARAIFLSYEPPEKVTKTLILVGKGVTYDTGGADIKAGGIMAGMHRDKCGSAAVAGFFQTVATLKPKHTRVLGVMAMVRNSIGPDCYVSDEIITSRAGVRIRIGNTDAEGRMAMVDFISYFKEKIVNEKLVNPSIFTIATLTGHCCLAVGDNYSIIMDNGPARQLRTAETVQSAGHEIGDPFEISTIRREDYEFNIGKSEYEDILQCNNAASSRTPRGHQLPAAFLIQVSGLDKHGIDSEKPIPFSHIDIAGSSGPFPGVPTGAPIAALTASYLLKDD